MRKKPTNQARAMETREQNYWKLETRRDLTEVEPRLLRWFLADSCWSLLNMVSLHLGTKSKGLLPKSQLSLSSLSLPSFLLHVQVCVGGGSQKYTGGSATLSFSSFAFSLQGPLAASIRELATKEKKVAPSPACVMKAAKCHNIEHRR